jgi:HSP20 family protein
MKGLVPWRQRNGGILEGFRQEMEDMFQRFFDVPYFDKTSTHEWAPRVDVEETEKEIVIKADLPGVDPKNLDISVVGGSLILKGEKKEEREDKKKNYHRVERFIGQFYREIPLPSGTDTEKISASSGKGVVTITIPKKPEIQPKKITVKAGD